MLPFGHDFGVTAQWPFAFGFLQLLKICCAKVRACENASGIQVYDEVINLGQVLDIPSRWLGIRVCGVIWFAAFQAVCGCVAVLFQTGLRHRNAPWCRDIDFLTYGLHEQLGLFAITLLLLYYSLQAQGKF